MDEAREAYGQMLRSYPDLTVSKFRKVMAYSEPTLDRIIANLKKLGLPD